MKFKVGDKVVCIPGKEVMEDYHPAEGGKEYTINRVIESSILVFKGDHEYKFYDADRFKKVAPKHRNLPSWF